LLAAPTRAGDDIQRSLKYVAPLLLLSCAHADGAKPAPAAPPARIASQPALDHDDIAAFMAEHFIVITRVRDSVINGELGGLREPLQDLAAYEDRTAKSGDWTPFLADLQQAARTTAEAKTLDVAANGVATMARLCGECHRAKASGPQFPEEKRTAGAVNSLEERMQRHIWAANRMWEGLTAPSDDAWNAGADVLANTQLQAPATQPALSSTAVSALTAVREIGVRARAATTSRDRAETYGSLLATCANCHSRRIQLRF
jgi:hypothetical protein